MLIVLNPHWMTERQNRPAAPRHTYMLHSADGLQTPQSVIISDEHYSQHFVMKDRNVPFDSGQVFNSIFRNRLATYESGHSTCSGTSGVIKCEELHASCATNSVERTTLLCVVTSYTLTVLGT